MEAALGGLGGLLAFGTLAALANLVGGLLLIKSGAHRLGERFLKYLVALGAGFMLAAIFIEILPETISIWTAGHSGSNAAPPAVPAIRLLISWHPLRSLFGHATAPRLRL